jgi:hypothetical protein
MSIFPEESEVLQWTCDFGKSQHKAPVIRGQTDKTSDLFYVDWYWPISYCGYFVRVCTYAFFGYNMTQKLHSLLEKYTFGRLKFQIWSG